MVVTSDGSIAQFSPIARVLITLDEAAKNGLQKLFDICFVMAKECIASNIFLSLRATMEWTLL